MTRSILLVAIALLVALIEGRPTEAAQVVVVRPDLFDQTAEKAPPLGCNVKLIGEVEQGDLARLETAYGTAVPGQKYNPSYLCLDSPGGNYAEAVAISRWLMGGGEHKGPWISTVVDDGATCASACALIFLAGSTFEHVAHIPNRWLHPNGRLGFHAPFLEEKALPTTNFTRQAIVSAFTAAQRSFLSLVNEFSARRRDHDAGPFPRPWVRLSLILDFMTRGPNEILWIDTVDEIGRWEIQLFGAKTPKRQLSIADAANACRNAIAWYSDRSSIELYSDTNPDNFYDRIELQKSDLTGADNLPIFAFWTSVRAVSTCVVSGNWRHGRAHFTPGRYDANQGGTEGYSSAFLFYSPGTRLRDLLDTAPGDTPADVAPPSPSRGAQPSFDCRTSTVSAEIAICSDEDLAALDNELAAAYASARIGLTDEQNKRLVSDQKSWLAQRNACRRDIECLSTRHRERIAALRNFAPFTTPSSATPSFDCATNNAAYEKAICATPDLAQIDNRVSRLYSIFMSTRPQGYNDGLREKQRNWLRLRNQCGADVDCLRSHYRSRLRELQSGG